VAFLGALGAGKDLVRAFFMRRLLYLIWAMAAARQAK